MSEEPQTGASEAFMEKRAALRQKLLTQHILNDGISLRFHGSFSGCGDSGNYDGGDYKNSEVDELFADALEEFVTFDWYNNDGGGGDITWDVVDDKITINGYYNEIVSTDVMSEEVF